MDAGQIFLDTHTLTQTADLFISSTIRHLQILSCQIEYITVVEWRIFDHREILGTYLPWCKFNKAIRGASSGGASSCVVHVRGHARAEGHLKAPQLIHSIVDR